MRILPFILPKEAYLYIMEHLLLEGTVGYLVSGQLFFIVLLPLYLFAPRGYLINARQLTYYLSPAEPEKFVEAVKRHLNQNHQGGEKS
jgi:hypothetical protein